MQLIPPNINGYDIARWGNARLAVLSAALLLCACASPSAAPPLDVSPPSTVSVTATLPVKSQGISKPGTGLFAKPPAASEILPAAAADGTFVDFDFQGAPVGLVVQTLLNDYAKANVIIDPRVRGEINLRSQGTLTARELPEFLKSSVRPLGLDLVDEGRNTYLLRPLPSADGAVSAELYQAGRTIPAGGVILPLKYVSATEMARLIAPFAKNGVTVQPETTREYLIITGPPSQVESLVKTIELLDVDWLTGMSFALVPLEASEPDALIAEVQKLFGGPNGPIGSMIEFVPLKSRQAILVLAKRPERLEEARHWISQLDRPDIGRFSRMQVIPVMHSEAAKLAETLKALFDKDSAVRITADEARNALIVQADGATMGAIRSILADLDKPSDQVVIEATIAEVTLNNDLKFGVQWFLDTRNGGTATFSDASNGAITSRFPGFSYGYTSRYVKATLNALASKTNVEIISTPVIVTLDNREATLQIGDQVPIVTQSAVNLDSPTSAIVNSVQYRDTGIVLKVTPRIGANNLVSLEISQEASAVASTTTSGIDSPTIQQRKFESTVLIADGETVALGGLIRAARSRGNSGLPVLKDIPVVGMAFKTTTNDVKRTELLVYLTPRIVRTPQEAATVTDDLRERLDRLKRSSFINRHAPVP